jgi:hypothetical protein
MWHNRRRVIYNTVIMAMKKLILFLMIAPVMAGCSKTKSIEFCEGMTPEGKGVRCGSVFQEGDLLAIIRSGEPFGVNSLTVRIYDKKGNKKEQLESFDVTVKPDRDTATANLSLYSGGTYLVEAVKKDATIGSGEIEISEK